MRVGGRGRWAGSGFGTRVTLAKVEARGGSGGTVGGIGCGSSFESRLC